MVAILTTEGRASAPNQRMILLREMIRVHSDFIVGNLRRLKVPTGELDDAVQDVFLVVHRRLGEYSDRGRTRAWLYSICTRVASEYRRRTHGYRLPDEVAFVDEGVPATQLDRIVEREAAMFGHRLLSILPMVQRQVFLLYEVEDMTVKEIASALDCPLQTAYSRLKQARIRIADEVHRLSTEMSAARVVRDRPV